MTAIIAGPVCVLAVAGMVACAVWYRQQRFRTISGHIDGLHVNVS